MSTSQTPLWLSMALAGIALIGPIGAALITTRNNNKRWEREHEELTRRDELQWRRDQFRILLESKSSWRDLRLEKYSQVMSKIDVMHRSAVKLLVDKRRKVPGASTGDYPELALFEELFRHLEGLALISNDEVRTAVYKLNKYLIKMLEYLTPTHGMDGDDLLVKATEQSRLYEEQRVAVQRVMREDLTAEIRDVNPSLPSETIS